MKKKKLELEKEIWLINDRDKNDDPQGAEIIMDKFVFGPSNPFALSNNTKLSILFKGKDLNIANQGLESQLIREAGVRPNNKRFLL